MYENTHPFGLLILLNNKKTFASLVVEEISILPSFIFYFMKIYILNGFCQFSYFLNKLPVNTYYLILFSGTHFLLLIILHKDITFLIDASLCSVGWPSTMHCRAPADFELC